MMGESEYGKYRAAGTAPDAKKYRSSTQGWDMTRNIAAGAAAVFGGLFLLLKW
jgi:hypothetical protein